MNKDLTENNLQQASENIPLDALSYAFFAGVK